MHRLKYVPFAFVAAAALASAPAAQAWHWRPIDDAATTVLAVAFAHGYDDDAPAECGAAAALIEYRLARARAAVPDVVASGSLVTGDVSTVFVLVPASAGARALQFCRALLDGAMALDDDLAAQAIARAALAADDADWLYPGSVLVGRARRALLQGPAARGVAGAAVAIQALTAARLGELLAQPVAWTAIGVGAVGDELRQATAVLPLPPAMPPVPPPPAVVPTVPAAVDVVPHPRIDGPFAAIAFAVPAAVDRAALAVALEVARARAARALRLRGNELAGRAPLVGWSWLQAEPVVVFIRRGPDGAEPDRPLAELETLLADLAARAPTAAELDSALRALRSECGLLAPQAAANGAALPGWATAFLLAQRHGLLAADLDRVTAATAQAALRATCEPSHGLRLGLVPATAPGSR